MPETLFKVGDLVRIVPARVSTHTVETFFDEMQATTPHGIFEVRTVLPEPLSGQREYRVKGGEPPHERVVKEGQIVHAGQPQPRR